MAITPIRPLVTTMCLLTNQHWNGQQLVPTVGRELLESRRSGSQIASTRTWAVAHTRDRLPSLRLHTWKSVLPAAWEQPHCQMCGGCGFQDNVTTSCSAGAVSPIWLAWGPVGPTHSHLHLPASRGQALPHPFMGHQLCLFLHRPSELIKPPGVCHLSKLGVAAQGLVLAQSSTNPSPMEVAAGHRPPLSPGGPGHPHRLITSELLRACSTLGEMLVRGVDRVRFYGHWVRNRLLITT